MSFGDNVKKYRVLAGLTQKQLAEELHVTYQAVSKWENGDAEPSIDSLKALCRILKCTSDQLFELDNPTDKKEKEKRLDDEKLKETQHQATEKVIVQESKPILALCSKCNRPIYDSGKLFRINETIKSRKGPHTHTSVIEKIVCKDCHEKILKAKKEEEERAERERKNKIDKKEIASFILPSICSIALIIASIVEFVNGDNLIGGILIACSVLFWFFLATMILNNTFVPDLWLEIGSWGFVKMPGLIFSLSSDGVAWLIVMRILLFLLSISLVLLAISFATVIAMIVSIFVYPSAIKRNRQYIE